MRICSRLIKTLICILLIVCLSGCWNSRELDQLGIVAGIGIDKADEPGKVQITAQVVKAASLQSAGNGSGGEGKAFWNIIATGNTDFAALRDMTNQSSRKLYFPNNQIIVIGRSMAEDGVYKCLDYFMRDHETRLNVLLLVSESSAEEILSVEPELDKVPSINIAKLVEGQAKATSQAMAVKLNDFKARLMSKTTAPVAPIIEITGEDDQEVAEITGTAVFKNDKMVGKLDKTEGRGLLWVLGKVQSGIIEIKSPDDNLVACEIIRTKGKIIAEIKDGKVNIKVKILEEGNFGEQTGTEDLSSPEMIEFLQKQKSKAIESEVIAAVKKAQELNADIFGFGASVNEKYPKEWKTMEARWDEIFPEIEVEVTAQTKIRLMGRINKPSVPKKEK